MNVAHFECPACEQPIEAPAASIAAGVRCPKCDTGFVPSNFQMTDEPMDASQFTGRQMQVGMLPQKVKTAGDLKREREVALEKQKWDEHHRLKEEAGHCLGLGCLLAGIGVACVIGALMNDNNIPALVIGSGLFSGALIFFLFSQLLHIRAGLEKLNNKD